MVADSDRFGELPDEIPDGQDDAQLEHLLKSVFAAPKISPEFSEVLGRELDRRFADDISAEKWGKGSASLNGRVQVTEVSVASQKPRTILRLVVTLAAAASLLIAASIWNSRPAYGWAAMMRALENCNWVQAVSQEPAVADNSLDGESELLALLMQKLAETHSNSSSLGFELIDESWESIENQDAAGEVIELRVTLKPVGETKQRFKLVFLLDPKTQLPLSCRLESEESSQATAYDFSYSKLGPTTFAVDAPHSDTSTEKLTSEVEKEPAAGASVSRESPHASAPSAESVRVGPLTDEQLVGQLNKLLTDYWQSQGIHSAEPATDTEFLRRVYLDLTGRIPMVSEVYQFSEETSENRRVLLVDDLLASRDHATHLAAIWRTMLLPEGADVRGLGGTAKFDEWLADRFGENLAYDQLVSQLLLAEGRVRESGPLLFYATLKLNPEEIAAKTSRVFLGTRMECAQCHDHPFDEKISQLDFWGFAAFFAQISRPLGKMDTTSPVLRVRDNREGEVMLPESEDVVFPRLPGVDMRASEEEGDGNDPSRRRQLVDWLVSQDNAQFSRAAVNRVWELLFGRGIIDPVDDMRAGVEPAVPGVLELLAHDFAMSGFDLRRLIRAIALSDAYQLSSRVETDDPSQTLCFARMSIKSLTASQLYDCIAVASRREETSSRPLLDGAVLRINNSTREVFIAQFRAPPGQRTDYQAGIPQALTLMHGLLIHQATDLASSGLLKSLGAPFFSDEQRVDTLFLATLSRMPESAERREMVDYVGAATNKEERLQALGDVLWALLNSAEFTFNH